MSKKRITGVVTASLATVLIIAGVWWLAAKPTPEQVFSSMLENSLSLRGVTRVTTQEAEGQSLEQVVQLQTGHEEIVAGRTVLKQSSQVNDSIVVTESTGNPLSDFVRYVSIETDQTGMGGQSLDFSEVLGVWGRSTDGSALSGGEFFSEATLGVVPISYLEPNERQEMIEKINQLQLYEIDYSTVQVSQYEGRDAYVYRVNMQPEKYISLLKDFAQIIGSKQLDGVNPNDFVGSPTLSMEMTVDILSRQLMKVSYSDSDRSEIYGSYGLLRDISLPKESITVEELQSRLQSIQ